ncbi:MAG: hypothetical protein RLZZ435_1996 [Cyanobacteriota bacterium]|jgi:hypothetical protein
MAEVSVGQRVVKLKPHRPQKPGKSQNPRLFYCRNAMMAPVTCKIMSVTSVACGGQTDRRGPISRLERRAS